MTGTDVLHRRPVGDTHVAWTDSGGPDRPTILLLHAGAFGAWFAPLAAEPDLARFRVVRLLRAGYAGDPQPPGPVGVAGHAAHAAAVLDALGVATACVVGHSSGSVVALQLALDRPDLVARLVLAEPPLIGSLADPRDAAVLDATLGPAIGAAMGAFASGDTAGAFGAFMDAVCGPDHRAVIAAALGSDGLARAERESAYFFADEAAAVARWEFDPARADRVRQPVLLVQGGASAPVVHRLVARLAGMLPDARVADVDGDDHLLPLRSPTALARLVAGFAAAGVTGGAGEPAAATAGGRS